MFKNSKDQLIVSREFLGKNMSTDELASTVLEYSAADFPECVFRDFCDVAGDQKHSTGKENERSDVEIFNKRGIRPQAKKQNIKPGLEQIRQLLRMRSDGRPGLIIDPRCTLIIEAFQGGYRYPDKEYPDENPEKDGYYDHLMDALRYAVVGVMARLEMKQHDDTMSEAERYKYVDPVIGV